MPEYGDTREIGFYVLTPTMFSGSRFAKRHVVQIAF